MENNNANQKIYTFDKTLFTKSYLPYMALLILGGVCIYLFTSLTYFDSLFYYDYQYLVYILLMFIGSNIIMYTRMRRLAKYNYFEVSTEDPVTFSIHKYGYAFEEIRAVSKISSLRKTPFSIIVRGNIEMTHLYYSGRPEPYVAKKKRIRIPAYFNNMDEIYAELEKMKKQS